MATVERLPIRLIQERLQRQHNLHLSPGGIIGLLRQVARSGQPTYQLLQAEIRASPVVHADETGWREDGVPGFIWTLSTPTTCLFHRDPHRSGTVIDGLLGTTFGGTQTVTLGFICGNSFVYVKWGETSRSRGTKLYVRTVLY
jgi:hypothetical protein